MAVYQHDVARAAAPGGSGHGVALIAVALSQALMLGYVMTRLVSAIKEQRVLAVDRRRVGKKTCRGRSKFLRNGGPGICLPATSFHPPTSLAASTLEPTTNTRPDTSCLTPCDASDLIDAVLAAEIEEPAAQAALQALQRVDLEVAEARSDGRPIASTFVGPPTNFIATDPLAPPVVCVHGFDSSCLEFRRLLPALWARGIEAYAVDVLGWGFTDRSGVDDFGAAAKRAHLKAICEAVEAIGAPAGASTSSRGVVLAGASLGGGIAIDLAFHAPSLVRGVVLLDPQAYVDGIGLPSLLPPPLMRAGVGVLQQWWLRSMANQMSYNDKPQFATDDAVRVGALHCAGAGWAEANVSYMRSNGISVSKLVSRVAQPVLLLWGRDDKILPPEDNVDRFLADLPDCKLKWIDRSGHVPHLEQADETSDAVATFIAERFSSSSSAAPSTAIASPSTDNLTSSSSKSPSSISNAVPKFGSIMCHSYPARGPVRRLNSKRPTTPIRTRLNRPLPSPTSRRPALAHAAASNGEVAAVGTTENLVVAVIGAAGSEDLATVPSPPPAGVEFVMGNSVKDFADRVGDINAIVWMPSGSVDTLSGLWPKIASRVLWIHSFSAGVDKLREFIDNHLLSPPDGVSPAAVLTNGRGAFSASLAEYVLLCCLHFAKQVPRWQANRVERRWDRFEMPVLYGKTIGFVGFGDIAKTTARLARAFGMRVIALRSRDPPPISQDSEASPLADVVFGPSDKLEVFRQADFVVCSLPGTATTRHFCSAAEFEQMGADGKARYFISCGRGAAVDEAALDAALTAGRVAGAALDVFETEPLPSDSPLWGHGDDKVLLTAHNADVSPDFYDLGWGRWHDNHTQFAATGEFVTLVNLDAGY